MIRSFTDSTSAMWTWSDLHCDYVHPVGGDYADQVWIRNLSRVQSDGAFDSHCESDVEQVTEHGWIMDPRNTDLDWDDFLPFRRHRWKIDYGCLENGSCVFVGNWTNTTTDFLTEFEIEVNVNNIIILIVGCIVSLLTILGNFIVNMFYIWGYIMFIIFCFRYYLFLSKLRIFGPRPIISLSLCLLLISLLVASLFHSLHIV